MIGDNAKEATPIAGATQAAVSSTTPASLIQKIEALGAKLDAAAKAEEAKAVTTVKGFFAKHWPWMVGVLTGLSRFLPHL